MEDTNIFKSIVNTLLLIGVCLNPLLAATLLVTIIFLPEQFKEMIE